MLLILTLLETVNLKKRKHQSITLIAFLRTDIKLMPTVPDNFQNNVTSVLL